MSLSNIREQVRAQVRGEEVSTKSLKELSSAERAAVLAMRRQAEKANKNVAFGLESWWL